jgi:hypothetical protein
MYRFVRSAARLLFGEPTASIAGHMMRAPLVLLGKPNMDQFQQQLFCFLAPGQGYLLF